MGRPTTHQKVAKPKSLPPAKSTARTTKAQNKRRSNQLKDVAYEALKANAKLALVATADGLSAAGDTATYVGRASCQFGEFLTTVSDGLTDQLSG